MEDRSSHSSGKSTSCQRKRKAQAANGDFELEEGFPALEEAKLERDPERNPRAPSPKCTFIPSEQQPSGMNAPHIVEDRGFFPTYCISGKTHCGGCENVLGIN